MLVSETKNGCILVLEKPIGGITKVAQSKQEVAQQSTSQSQQKTESKKPDASKNSPKTEQARIAKSESTESYIPATIKGKVYRSDTNKPIADATVKLEDATLDSKDPNYTVAKITTDQQGQYSFTNVKPGKYSITAVAGFTGKSDPPCTGSASSNRDGWTIIPVTQTEQNFSNNTVVVRIGILATGDNFDITAGELLQKNIDLKCIRN